MKAVILIGGMGTRLRPLTCSIPKPLLPIINRPFLEYQFDIIRKHGIKEVILCVSYMSAEFRRYFGNGEKLGLKIKYVHEKHPLGTGGAIKNAAKFLDQPFVIFNGDILTDIDLTSMKQLHKKAGALATLALTRVKDPTIYGLVETDKQGRIERFLEKPTWDEVTSNTINAGIYLFEPEILDFIPPGVNFSVERGLFPDLLKNKKNVTAYIFNSYWLDIGSVEKYLQANQDVMEQHIRSKFSGRKLRENVWAGKNARISKSCSVEGKLICGNNVTIGDFAQIRGNVCLGDNVSIGKGGSIADSVVLHDTRLGDGVKIERALIAEKCSIEANSNISTGAAIGSQTVVRKYSRL
jgi:NDP-sugar pyrophosphorylase family protein